MACAYIYNNSQLEFNRSNDITYAGIISGTGTVTKNGTGKLILTGENTYTGITTINAGILQLGNGTTYGDLLNTAEVKVASGANLRFEIGNESRFFHPKITGAGGVQFLGGLNASNYPTGLCFTAEHTYTGKTTVENGTFQIGSIQNTFISASRIVGNIEFIGNKTQILNGQEEFVNINPAAINL